MEERAVSKRGGMQWQGMERETTVPSNPQSETTRRGDETLTEFSSDSCGAGRDRERERESMCVSVRVRESARGGKSRARGGNRAHGHPRSTDDLAAPRIASFRLASTRIADCKPFTMPRAKSPTVTLVDARLARASARVTWSRAGKERRDEREGGGIAVAAEATGKTIDRELWRPRTRDSWRLLERDRFDRGGSRSLATIAIRGTESSPRDRFTRETERREGGSEGRGGGPARVKARNRDRRADGGGSAVPVVGRATHRIGDIGLTSVIRREL